MKAMVCEMCQSNDLVKQDGMFVCQYCGTKYSVEEAKKMMIEGTVDVSGSTVKVDTSGELANLYQIARRAKEMNNCENASKYYDMILIKDPTSWEASFYVVYFKATQCKIAQIESAALSVKNCIYTVLRLIKDNISNREEQKAAYTEVAIRVMTLSEMLNNAAFNHYISINYQIRDKYREEYISNNFASIRCFYTLGDNLDSLFETDTEANQLSVAAWKKGIVQHQVLIPALANKDINRNTINDYVSKIKKYDSTYTLPQEITSSGCYVATAVYGSYDCPQVWTLRRFRDYTLAETWYGRAFIHTYYAISPTLVKWFGHYTWFKNIWKPVLDKMVDKLNNSGVDNTPYNDRNW